MTLSVEEKGFLEKALSPEEDQNVRFHAAQKLGLGGYTSSLDVLCEMAQQEDPQFGSFRLMALSLLGRFFHKNFSSSREEKEKARKALQGVVLNREMPSGVRSAAVKALGYDSAGETKKFLKGFYNNEDKEAWFSSAIRAAIENQEAPNMEPTFFPKAQMIALAKLFEDEDDELWDEFGEDEGDGEVRPKEEPIAKIRAHLSAGASAEAWLGICHALEEADLSEREMLLEYVAGYTKGWEARLCRPLYGWWERYIVGEETGYEGVVRDWSGYVWEEGKFGGERRVYRVGGVEFTMRWVPAGEFKMGSLETDEEAYGWEKPQREVRISRGFWMTETPVTQGQYEAIVGSNPSDFKDVGLNAPVEKVSWYDAALFANKLSDLEGLEGSFVEDGEGMRGVGDEAGDYVGSDGWRLPTEAEWEYACRAGSREARYGDLEAIAWYDGNSGKTTQPVGEKVGNAWGLKDMLGNVWEWCYDWYDEKAYEILSGSNSSVDPVFVQKRTKRVVRGGCWFNVARYVRSAKRYSFAPTARGNFLGFRLLRR